MPNRISGIGSHHSPKAGTVEWLTPPEIIAALGPFDLDPCAPEFQPHPTAARKFTKADNGLIKRWDGRVFLNPPYANGVIEKWLARMADHDRGTALIFARTETDAFFEHVWNRCSALLFIRGRITFRVGEPFEHVATGRRYEVGDVAPGNAGAPTVLCAYGTRDADVLAACNIAGKFVPLRIPRIVVIQAFAGSGPDNADVSWREAVAEFFRDRGGPVSLSELYSAFASHPKSATNPNFQAKIRQQVQAGSYRRIGRGVWEQHRAEV